MAQKRCTATTTTGKACNGSRYQGSEWCWFHHPGLESARAEGRRLGGRAKSNRARAAKQIEQTALSAAELQGVVSATILNVLAGRTSPGVANAVAGLARASVAIREAVEIEERLTELERSLISGRRIA